MTYIVTARGPEGVRLRVGVATLGEARRWMGEMVAEMERGTVTVVDAGGTASVLVARAEVARALPVRQAVGTVMAACAEIPAVGVRLHKTAMQTYLYL